MKNNDFGLKNSIKLLGNRSDTNRLYQAMDVFVFPSRVEGMGLAAIEAQAASVPVIASTELPDEVEIASNIKRIDLNNGADYWAKAIVEVKPGQDEHSIESMQKKGFDIQEQAGKMADYYLKLLKEK